jgi:hypothetical protein
MGRGFGLPRRTGRCITIDDCRLLISDCRRKEPDERLDGQKGQHFLSAVARTVGTSQINNHHSSIVNQLNSVDR